VIANWVESFIWLTSCVVSHCNISFFLWHFSFVVCPVSFKQFLVSSLLKCSLVFKILLKIVIHIALDKSKTKIIVMKVGSNKSGDFFC